jgi:hypothetical protein
MGVVLCASVTTFAQLPSGIWISQSEILTRPTSGAAWTSLLAAANKSCGTPDLTNQEDPANVCVMAKALVFARTGQSTYRQEVVTALTSVINAPTYNGRALALGRELAAYVIAADLIDLKNFNPVLDSSFRFKIQSLLVAYTSGGPQNLIYCHEERPNNWGTHCGASRAAIAAYLGDRAELDATARVFKGWLGDRSSYASFAYGDTSWQCDPSQPVGINPTGCTKEGHLIDGVLPDDQRRASTFMWPAPQENYVYEALQGALAQAVILRRAGYDDVFEWQNRALLRAFNWLYTQNGFQASGDDGWQPYVINHFYGAVGANFAAPSPSQPGKNVGWTDWTFQGQATAPATPKLSVSPLSLNFTAQQGGIDPAAQSVQVTNAGGGSLTWTASSSASMWVVSPASGGGGGSFTVKPSIGGLAAGTYQSQVTVTASGAQQSPTTVAVSLTVTAAAPTIRAASISLSPSSVTGGTTSVGTVTLSSAAGTGGAVVGLTRTLSIASLPASVTVPAGATSANFNVTTSVVSTTQQVAITATLNGSVQAVLTISPAGGGSSTTRTVTPSADALVRGGSYANTNYGTLTSLEIKDGSDASYDRRGLARFDVRGSAVTSALLKLYVSALPNGSPAPVCAFATTDAWTENGVTWSNQPAVGASLGCVTATATGWMTIDVTAFVKQELAGDGFASFVLQDSTLSNRMARLNSRESSTNRPTLEIK